MLLPESKIFSIARAIFPAAPRFKLFRVLKDWIVFKRHRSLNPYHVEVIKKYVRRGSRVVDVGANCGDYSALFLSLGARVDAFEASTIFRKLYERFNGNPNIRLHFGAIGNTDKEITLNEFPDSKFSTATGKKDGGEVIISHKVPCNKLDRFDLSPDFVKIDVEGMDYEVLRGAESMLRTWKPVVMAEANPLWLAERGYSIKDMTTFMDKLGYYFEEVVSCGIVMDLLFIPRDN